MPVESPRARPTLRMMIGTGYLEQVVPQCVKNFVIYKDKFDIVSNYNNFRKIISNFKYLGIHNGSTANFTSFLTFKAKYISEDL